MSDVQKLKDAIAEYNKETKEVNDKLNKIVEDTRQRLVEQAEKQNHPN